MTDRAGYISGLRQLADALERDPHIELPGDGREFSPVTIGFYGDDARERMAAAVRALGGRWEKDAGTKWLNLNSVLSGLHIQLYAAREQVCTRRVTGTEVRDVEVEVTPAVKRTEKQEVEIVEWDCSPVLGQGGAR